EAVNDIARFERKIGGAANRKMQLVGQHDGFRSVSRQVADFPPPALSHDLNARRALVRCVRERSADGEPEDEHDRQHHDGQHEPAQHDPSQLVDIAGYANRSALQTPHDETEEKLYSAAVVAT